MPSELHLHFRGIGDVERPEARAVEAPGQASFAKDLGAAVGELDKMQTDADQQSSLIAQGAGNLHEVAISLEKADVAMRLAMKVRNKVVDAYNEIMRMSV
jgi:flagellar hook-basal body complex protein FliE